MSRDVPVTIAGLHLVGLEELRKHWLLLMIIGMLLTFLGIVALGYSVLVSIIAIKFVGWLMIIGGIFEAVHAFSMRNWGGFFLDLLAGILYVVVGFLVVSHPLPTVEVLTLFIAMFLIFGGIFRMVAAISIRFQNRFWLFLSGAINLLLGVLIWQQWPVSGLWVIGMFIGIDMIFNGTSLVMLALAAKRLPTELAKA